MLASLWTAEIFVYAALLFYVLGFLFRDELWLRGLLFVGTIFYIIYYYYAASNPLWDAILTSSILGVVNVAMIGVVIWERTKFTMSSDQASIYAYFPNMSPGQFRRLMKAGQIVEATSAVDACFEDQPLERFYFLLDGEAAISKQGQITHSTGGHFFGEVAFLTGSTASASVRFEPGARYVVWEHASLQALMEKAPNLSNALLARLNLDMAGKVAGSFPLRSARNAALN